MINSSLSLSLSQQWRAVDSIKHCDKQLSLPLWINVVFDKELFSHHKDISIEFETSVEVSSSRHLKAHNLCNKGVFSSIILSQLVRLERHCCEMCNKLVIVGNQFLVGFFRGWGNFKRLQLRHDCSIGCNNFRIRKHCNNLNVFQFLYY